MAVPHPLRTRGRLWLYWHNAGILARLAELFFGLGSRDSGPVLLLVCRLSRAVSLRTLFLLLLETT